MKMSGKKLLNEPIDVSGQFNNFDNTYFYIERLLSFDIKTGQGVLLAKRFVRKYRMSFNCITAPLENISPWEFPPEYECTERLSFSISFVSDGIVRIQYFPKGKRKVNTEELMLIKKIEADTPENIYEDEQRISYTNKKHRVVLVKNPFHIEIYDLQSNSIIKTVHYEDNTALDNSYSTPICYAKNVQSLQKTSAFSFSLDYNEGIFGCGESFTGLNKRGQKINLSTYDALGAQSAEMYKPIPFFMSSKGYGIFVHSTAAMTFDFGSSYDQTASLYIDDNVDIFIFTGTPKEILYNYTDLTGRSPMLPKWSFGLWMSRITYKSEEEVRNVAAKLRCLKIPCDVIHLDTGWFEDDWKCNYKFSHTRFNDPKKMIADLREQGFHISLWQLPYFTPTNELYDEIIQNKYAVFDSDGFLPTEDAVLDFSNPDAKKWYEKKLKTLFDIGVEAIKADFGEAAPVHGVYYSKQSGKYEHNLYPLRYNQTVFEATKQATRAGIIWGRSAWAGSQRYPLHWAGDAEITDSAMAATLRAGLSLGLCGFTFWSHDIGGFTQRSPEDLYLRWLAFGMLTSHSRCHGQPPKEPWEYGEEFTDMFRKIVEFKYSLLPYILEQSLESLEKGFPLLRTLFFEYPDDKTAWYIDDEYFFGDKILVAPIFKSGVKQRDVYLPSGEWVHYFTKEIFQGRQWHSINTAELPIVIMVKKGSKIKHVPPAQAIDQTDWNQIYEKSF